MDRHKEEWKSIFRTKKNENLFSEKMSGWKVKLEKQGFRKPMEELNHEWFLIGKRVGQMLRRQSEDYLAELVF